MRRIALIAAIITGMTVHPQPKYEVITYEEYQTRYEATGGPETRETHEVDLSLDRDTKKPTADHREPETYTVTAYCSCSKCCGEWSDGFTSTGDLAHEGVTIAVDPEEIPLGTRVWIDGIGERVAQDIGGAIKGKRIDIFFYNHQAALNFGVQYLEVSIIQ